MSNGKHVANRRILGALGAILLAATTVQAAQMDAIWVGGASNWSNPINWLDSVVPNNNANDTFNVLIDTNGGASSAALLDGTFTIDNLTIDADDSLIIDNGHSLHVVVGAMSGVIDNAGVIDVLSSGIVAEIRAAGGAVMLTGGGTVNLSDNAANRIWGFVTTDRIVNVDNTIQGAGNIGFNITGFTNQSLVVANVPTALIMDPTGTQDITNTGTLRAADGGTLVLGAGLILNNGGMIEALDNSVVTLSSATIDGGTLQTAGTGVIQTAANETLDGSTNVVTNAGDFVIKNGDDLIIVGTLNNTGTIEVASTGSASEIRASGGDAFLAGGGTVTMTDNAANRIWGFVTTDRIVNVDNTIQGAGSIGLNITGFTNQSLVVANLPTALTIDPPLTQDITNTGTLRAEDGGTLVLGAGLILNNGGVIEALDNSVVTLSSATIDGGTLQTAGTGVIQTAANETLDGSTNVVTNAGSLRVENGDDLIIVGTLNNTGTIEVASTGSASEIRASGGDAFLAGGGIVLLGDHVNNRILGIAATDRLINVDNTIQGAGNIGFNITGFTNQGTIIADSAVPLTIDPSASEDFTNEGDLQATAAGGVFLAAGTFTTSGSVSVTAGSAINRSGDYTQTAGSTTVDGALSATGIVDIQDGILQGSGTVIGAVSSAGSVRPGSSAGILTIDDDYAQQSDGELFIEIGGTIAGSQHDRLDVSGVATLDGTLQIEFIDGYDPVVGDSFVVMTADSLVGDFAGLTAPCLPTGRVVQVTVGPTNVLVTISDAVIGDADCDCALSALDIEAFLLALLDPPAYLATYTNCAGLAAVDMNGDTKVDGNDIAPFVDAYIP